jgi:acetaldehyde dehydrogenase
MRVAIIGTGNIGTDLLIKLLKLEEFEVVGFVGRRPSTKSLPCNVKYFDNGIQFFIINPKCCDLVFDCTDAYSAIEHAKIFLEQDIFVIDMTPSKIGRLCVPNINCFSLDTIKNVNMITCGGQVSIPLIKYISSKCKITYVEVVTQISSESAGMATRINVDKYIETTENAIKTIIGVPDCKVILNVNPCKTTIMKTTLFFKSFSNCDFGDFENFIKTIKSYIQNYKVTGTSYENGILMISVDIVGSGDYLSKYAGNLDVINCAAIEVAKLYNKNKKVLKQDNEYDKILDI